MHCKRKMIDIKSMSTCLGYFMSRSLGIALLYVLFAFLFAFGEAFFNNL